MNNLLQTAMQMTTCLAIAAVIGIIIGYLLAKSICNHNSKMDKIFKDNSDDNALSVQRNNL